MNKIISEGVIIVNYYILVISLIMMSYIKYLNGNMIYGDTNFSQNHFSIFLVSETDIIHIIVSTYIEALTLYWTGVGRGPLAWQQSPSCLSWIVHEFGRSHRSLSASWVPRHSRSPLWRRTWTGLDTTSVYRCPVVMMSSTTRDSAQFYPTHACIFHFLHSECWNETV